MSKINLPLATMCVALALLGTVDASAAGPSPASMTKASAPAVPTPPVDASLARITELTRQLKVAELQKQLREANATSAPIPVQGGNAPAPIPSIGFMPKMGIGAIGALKAPSTAVQPSIQSITSIGGKYSAVTAEGRPLSVGSQIFLSDALWKVTNILPYGVDFDRCLKGKCTAVTVSVGR